MKILLIGCGKMGSAMLAGWLRSGISPDSIRAIDPFLTAEGVQSYKSIGEMQDFIPDYVVIATKPQMLDNVLPSLRKFVGATFISIAAGKKISFFSDSLGSNNIVRAMPNLPALIGEGVTGIYASELATEQKADIESIFAPLGAFIWLKSEDMVDSITAISGSGPAYVFLFIQALADAAEELGFSAAEAKNIAIQTVTGAANTARKSVDPIVKLKEDVTSKGGTTAAALEVLEDNNVLKNLIKSAAKAAFARSKELSE